MSDEEYIDIDKSHNDALCRIDRLEAFVAEVKEWRKMRLFPELMQALPRYCCTYDAVADLDSAIARAGERGAT